MAKILAFLVFGTLTVGSMQSAIGDDKSISIGPFGSKPIQLSVDKGGVKRKYGGYICEIDATLGGGHYSEWGETEKDAREIVHKTCSDKSGLLLCKKENAKCHQDPNSQPPK